MRRLTAYISGKVQKTGYRARVLSIARDFGLLGYVQNLDDGRVKVGSCTYLTEYFLYYLIKSSSWGSDGVQS
jgi:acylphosphatase